jgi:hypothetical protein
VRSPELQVRRVMRLIGGSDMHSVPTINAAHAVLAAGEQDPEQHAGGLGAGQRIWHAISGSPMAWNEPGSAVSWK